LKINQKKPLQGGKEGGKGLTFLAFWAEKEGTKSLKMGVYSPFFTFFITAKRGKIDKAWGKRKRRRKSGTKNKTN